MAVVEARSSLYRRAQQLTENDPREAEALYVKFIRETGAHKLKRAAYHELFALRLKEARLAEAFFQINKKSFRRRYVSAMEENLHLSNRRAQRLLSVLERECNPERDTEKLREYLEASKATVLEYNYVLRVQTLCGNNDTLAVLPELPVSNDDFDENKFYTALLTVQEILEKKEFDDAKNWLSYLRDSVLPILSDKIKHERHLLVAEARAAITWADWPVVEERCVSLKKLGLEKSTHRSCLYLRAFAFAMQDDFDTAYNLIKKIKRGMREIDNRLLYLIVAVGANKEDISALKRFIHRQSYRENASSLRRLAQKILLS